MTKNAAYYGPAIRMKGGELIGLHGLAVDIADHTLPRLIVPPPADRDDELQARLISCEAFPDISAMLAAHWRRPILVDSTHLLDEFGRDRMEFWLPRMFERARLAGARPVPLATINDLLVSDLAAYRAALDSSASLKFGIVFSSGDLADSELVKQGLGVLEKLRLSSDECIVIADFHDADFSNPGIVSPIIGGVLDTLHAAAQWQKIIFQGTNYPEKNPAEPNSYYLVPRNEWISWRQAVAFDPDTADHMIFGDYAADCAKLDFNRSGGGRAIRHFRYATPDAWLVQRGADQGSHATTMRAVSKAIIDSGMFAGRDFSAADDHIFRISKGGQSGSAREWRAINTTHHITRVVTDIGHVRGVRFSRKEFAPIDEQLAIL